MVGRVALIQLMVGRMAQTVQGGAGTSPPFQVLEQFAKQMIDEGQLNFALRLIAAACQEWAPSLHNL